MNDIAVGVIGGSGVYALEGIKVLKEVRIKTPFGLPSDDIIIADVNGRSVAFLPRHGKGHRLLPTEVPSQANIYALKSLGVKKIIAVSAVGSLKEEIRPTDLVLPSQIIDRIKTRPLSFFGKGIVGHVSFADPFCNCLRDELKTVITQYIADNRSQKRLFTSETYVCMEGPQFSTRAESNLYRSWGAGVIGMTAIPEAKLAREAEICYATIALPTDYDCWRENEAAVEVSHILEYMKENNKTINALLPLVITAINPDRTCSCEKAAEYAVMTSRDLIPAQARKNLALFYGKYWKR